MPILAIYKNAVHGEHSVSFLQLLQTHVYCSHSRHKCIADNADMSVPEFYFYYIFLPTKGLSGTQGPAREELQSSTLSSIL